MSNRNTEEIEFLKETNEYCQTEVSHSKKNNLLGIGAVVFIVIGVLVLVLEKNTHFFANLLLLH